jgi:hypothetical protein
MSHPQVQRGKSTFGGWRVRRIFEWLKRKPNPELVKIEDKLELLNQTVTVSAESQAMALSELNEKTERTLQERKSSKRPLKPNRTRPVNRLGGLRDASIFRMLERSRPENSRRHGCC